MTQAQANAIADSECPAQDAPGWTAYSAHIKIQRQAYAQCLMDLNALIEAATEMRESITCENQTDGATPRCCDACWGMIAWDTALSNLTKNVAHLMTAPNPNK